MLNRCGMEAAKAAKIAVWWDMMDCPIPQMFRYLSVRPSLEAVFKNLGYSGPVSITAYGDQTQTSVDLLRYLSSTGVDVVHTTYESRYSLMYSDMVEWRGHNPPPATMMIISNQVVAGVFTWDLTRLQQRTRYNLYLAYSIKCDVTSSSLSFSSHWLWEELLGYAHKDYWLIQYELSGMLYCKSCKFVTQSPHDFQKHLWDYKHGRREFIDPATPEYATAKIVVWWDMFDCPILEGYDARRVRPSLEAAFKNRGYSGPVSITAYGDQTQTSVDLLRCLSSTGVDVVHTTSESRYSLMYSDMVEWRGHNPPPATMMIISNHVVEGVFTWDLTRLQQRTRYNLYLAYSIKCDVTSSSLSFSSHWLWKELLGYADTYYWLIQYELSGMLYCKSCKFETQSPHDFRKHLWGYKHGRREFIDPTYQEVHLVTEKWGRNYPAMPEYATAKIVVWWDMFDCPIPEGYDARRVRPSLEAAFKNLGYSGPVSITAYGDLKHIPDHLLQGLSSTGVNVAHTLADYKDHRMHTDLTDWLDSKPPPATLMVITDIHHHHWDMIYSICLVHLLQKYKHNLFRAYSCRPLKMSCLLTSAEWLWESLLAVSETRRHVLRRCSESESESKSESTAMFYCKVCKGPDYFKNLDDFRTHLSSEEHAQVECAATASYQNKEKEHRRYKSAQYDQKAKRLREIEKSKPLKKPFRTGFRLLDNHLRRKPQW